MKPNCSEQDIIQNLKDAGCDEALIQAFIDAYQQGKPSKGNQLLQKHRQRLLDNLHMDQKQIDCLDYLLYVLQKQS